MSPNERGYLTRRQRQELRRIGASIAIGREERGEAHGYHLTADDLDAINWTCEALRLPTEGPSMLRQRTWREIRHGYDSEAACSS